MCCQRFSTFYTKVHGHESLSKPSNTNLYLSKLGAHYVVVTSCMIIDTLN